jgi:hypothetical protein
MRRGLCPRAPTRKLLERSFRDFQELWTARNFVSSEDIKTQGFLSAFAEGKPFVSFAQADLGAGMRRGLCPRAPTRKLLERSFRDFQELWVARNFVSSEDIKTQGFLSAFAEGKPFVFVCPKRSLRP